MDYNSVRKLVKEHTNGKVNRRLFIWSLLNTEFWLEKYFKLIMEDKFEHIKNQYSKAVEKYGDSPESLLWPKGRQDIRFNNLISPLKNIITKETLSLCDFGCGLAHLEEYIINKKINLEYKGLDFVPSLIV